MAVIVPDFESCRLAVEAPGDPSVGLAPYRQCSWTGQECGCGNDGPTIVQCPRFAEESGAPCPVCASQGVQTLLRHDAEYNLYACPVCPEAQYFGQRALFAAYRGLVADFSVAANGEKNARESVALAMAAEVVNAPEDYRDRLQRNGRWVDTEVQGGGAA